MLTHFLAVFCVNYESIQTPLFVVAYGTSRVALLEPKFKFPLFRCDEDKGRQTDGRSLLGVPASRTGGGGCERGKKRGLCVRACDSLGVEWVDCILSVLRST